MTLFLFTTLFLTACINKSEEQEKRKANLQKKDFGAFSLDVPLDWKEIGENGPDFSFQTFIDADNDTFGLYTGRYAQYPEFSETYIFDPSEQQRIDTFKDKPNFAYAFGDRRNIDRNRINMRNLIFEKVNGVNARFIYPRDRQKGNIQFNVDSMGKNRTQIDFWGTNLPAKKQDIFFKVCRTINPE